MVCNRDTLILYSAATCNLNCVYCAIDKNPALVEIDKMLAESFADPNYYIDFIKEIFPDPLQLSNVEIWGGEPFLAMDRIIPTLRNIIKAYPNYSSFFVSSNMTLPNWIEGFQSLINLFSEFPEREFTFRLQMSLDGTQEITDHNRGVGVTSRLTNTFYKLLDYCDNNPLSNVNLSIFFKPTLTIDDIKQYLSTEGDIIEYYLFFEQYLEAFHNKKLTNVDMGPTVPNMAAPSPHTQEEGFLFRDFVKMCYNINVRNRKDGIFKFYTDILPFRAKGNIVCTNCVTCGGMCGSGYNVIGLLPNNTISACHSGFTSFLEEYKLKAKSRGEEVLDKRIFQSGSAACLIFPKEDLERYELQIANFYKENTTALKNNLAAQIIMAAYAGQIDHKYRVESEAIRAANYLIMNTANCIRDNLAINGSITLLPIGQIRLLLNGARDYLDENNYA